MEDLDSQLPFISFRCYNKSYLYILGFWIFEAISILIKNKYSENPANLQKNREASFINLICNVIADLFAGFLVLFTICSMNTGKNNKTFKRKKSKREAKLIHMDTIKVKNRRSFSLLILISFLQFLSLSAHFLFFLFVKVNENEKSVFLEEYQMDWLIALDIILRHIFSRSILKAKLYKHHIWSLYICIPAFIFMAIIDIFSIIFEKKNIKIIYHILLTTSRAILFPLEDVINKKLLTVHFKSPQSLMFFRGLIQTIILFIVSTIFFLTGILNISLIGNNIANILIRSVFIFFKYFCLIKVIDKFTPQHVSFIIIVKSFLGVIKQSKVFNKYEASLSIFDLIFLLIILFGTLLYNEMIIINKWDLNKYTKEGLLTSEKKEKEDDEENNEEKSEEKSEENDEENIEEFDGITIN